MTPPGTQKRRPGGGASNDLLAGEISSHSTSLDESPALVDPRDLVRRVRMTTLIDAWVGDEVFGVIDDSSGYRFLCPRCGHRDHNGGTAQLIDAWSWHCWRCQWDGTRMRIENLVLESRAAVERLFKLVNEGAR